MPPSSGLLRKDGGSCWNTPVVESEVKRGLDTELGKMGMGTEATRLFFWRLLLPEGEYEDDEVYMVLKKVMIGDGSLKVFWLSNNKKSEDSEENMDCIERSCIGDGRGSIGKQMVTLDTRLFGRRVNVYRYSCS